MDSQPLLVLDFGGTKLSAALCDSTQPDWLGIRRMTSPPDASAESDIRIVTDIARDLLQDHKPGAVGVSFGGPVDFDTGTVYLSHHVPGWEGIPLKSVLENEFNCPAQVDNDANAGALGEHTFGAGRGLTSLMYITVSTGVGGGWILNKKPWRGSSNMAGEIGHTVVDPDGPECLCGKKGCVERLASGRYMAEDARKLLKANQNSGSILRGLIKNHLEDISGEMLSQAANLGDNIAIELLNRAAWALGSAIGNAANLINPERFILGGGVTKAGADFWEAIRQQARATALPEIIVDIVPAGLRDDAPLWGARILALNCLETRGER